ncbi:MAG: toprim domain-containing protein, partial [Comamonadaceae bacterium]
VKGECIGFGGRVLGDEKPKYLNSPETPVFSKGRELYGLYEARAAFRDKGYALVTEGYMDVVALAQLGFPNAVATLGTACTPEHVQKLFRFTESVVFSFDGDAAGRRAARKALDGAISYATDVRSIKFLFLPTEHDPDSFIREFGADAFARFVTEATPLSRFMLEAAREGCDLGTAEGRAHMTSNVRPMWGALPDGALKQQLLAEIGTMVQLSPQSLADLWRPAPAAHRPDTRPDLREDPRGEPPEWTEPSRYQNDRYSRKRDGRWGPKAPPYRPAPGGRTLPLGRPDVAARLLLSNMAQWESLSHELHAILCELPGDHGRLFAWLDSQLHEHGVQSWAALREGLREQPFEALAVRLMTGPDGGPIGDAEGDQLADAARELGSVLDYMLDDRLKAQQSEAIAAVGRDPLALERYKALEARRLALRSRLKKSTDSA